MLWQNASATTVRHEQAVVGSRDQVRLEQRADRRGALAAPAEGREVVLAEQAARRSSIAASSSRRR